MVGALDVSIVKGRTELGNRREELGVHLELLLIGGLHVLRTPTKVPDGRRQFPGRRRLNFVEKNPGLLRPDRVGDSREFRFLAVEFASVEIDGSGWIERVQLKMMEVRDRHCC